MSEPYLPPEDAEARDHGGSSFFRIGKMFVAGTVGGFVECVASYPLDTIKTRMQTQPGAGGPLTCFVNAIREDGVLALYRGMSSRIVANMISASVLFGANATLKELFDADPHKPLSVRFMAAAMGTGVLEAIVYCPLELFKTRMQVLRGSRTGVTTWSTGMQIYRDHGLFKGWYRGFSSLLLREGLGNTVYFGSYELCKQTLSGASHVDEAGPSTIAAAGGVTGALYTIAVHPIDTVKSLIQTDSMEKPRYRGFIDAYRQALAAGGGGARGFAKLYRGLSPAVARAFVGNAALFLTFESSLNTLGR